MNTFNKVCAAFMAAVMLCLVQPHGATIIVRGPIGAGGGGPDAWYETETLANADTFAGTTTDELQWVDVYVTTGGTATKIRIACEDNQGSGNIKLILYPDAGGSALAYGEASFTVSSHDNTYLEATLVSPVSVTSATTYKLAWIGDSGNLRYKYDSTTSVTLSYKGTETYSEYPKTLPTAAGTVGRGVVIGLYVD